MLSLNPKDMAARVFYSYMTTSIAPRPIAFASTVDADGNVNLSPFSFFNIVGIDPPLLVFSPNNRGRDNSKKNTTENIEAFPEVVINLVDYAMVQQMSLSSCEFPKGTNEFVKAGFTEQASVLVKPPRVKEAPVQFECKILEIKSYGTSNIAICEIVMAHIAENLLDEHGKIDQLKTDWVARMGADWYARITPEAMFEVPKPNVHLGVGVDSIPEFVKNSELFDGNDLGKLGNESNLPSEEDSKTYLLNLEEKPSLLLAKALLDQNKIRDAWAVILGLE